MFSHNNLLYSDGSHELIPLMKNVYLETSTYLLLGKKPIHYIQLLTGVRTKHNLLNI